MAPDIRPIEVQCITLNDFFRRENTRHCVLLKLEREGADLRLLTHWMQRPLGPSARSFSSIIWTASRLPLIAWLQRLGFGRIGR